MRMLSVNSNPGNETPLRDETPDDRIPCAHITFVCAFPFGCDQFFPLSWSAVFLTLFPEYK